MSPTDQARVAEDIAHFVEWWLVPARRAPPSIAFEVREAREGAVVARARPLLPEQAPWNQWNGDGARLFNDRVAYLFEVEIRSEGPVRWVPKGSRLELNEPGRALDAVDSADELLKPLLSAALDQERWVLDGDLVDRTRAAGPFRAAYLSTRPAQELVGVVAFPIGAEDVGVSQLRLTLKVEDADGAHDIVWVYE